MVITDNICSTYDFLTYDTTKGIFVNECFTCDSFITTDEDRREDIKVLIEKIGEMIKEVGLESLMYEKIMEYEKIRIESIHVPENYKFKHDSAYELS